MYKMPMGIDSFRELIEKNYYFVDKTLLIKELLDSGSKVTLITRPRRFGKTLAQSMLKEFFDINSADSNIFDGLKISQDGSTYMRHRGKYPVIFLSLKDIARGDYGEALRDICGKISDLYADYEFLSYSPALSDREKRYFASVCYIGENEFYGKEKWGKSLKVLTMYLWKHYGSKPIVLLDEYDAPIQSAWEDGYYDEMLRFMRQLYSEVLKGNKALEFAVLTGVLRVAKESIFSGLNNLQICSVLSEAYNDAFGFTAGEVVKMAHDLHCGEKLPELKEWYDGYTFAGADMYNPWSVIQYFQEDCKAGAYWVNTSGNGIIKQLLRGMGKGSADDLRSLMEWKIISKQVSEGVIYEDIGKNPDDLYTLLLAAGYLKCVRIKDDLYGQEAELKIPNKEIYSLFGREILANMMAGGAVSDLRKMLNAMLSGCVKTFEAILATIVRNNVSYYDAANGESFYHGMMLGFCVLLKDTHLVESNRESGYGRFDLALLPVDKRYYGVVLEFKRAENESQLEGRALEAFAQIEELSYVAEFEKRQIKNVWKYGIAFYGKRVCLRGA